MSKVKLPFGLRGERLLSIGEVERGLACGCVCPACRQPLVARKGPGKVHHFSHYRGEACGFGLESALHHAAKRLLTEVRKIMLPAVYLPNHRAPVFSARMMHIDALWMEQRTARLVPDLLLRSGKRWLLVEVAVTHPSGEEKIRRIRKMGYAALEVDLRDMQATLQDPGGQWDDRLLERRLVWRQMGKSWLFNPRLQALEVELQRRSMPKKVHHRCYHDKHYYTVRPCPASKRVWAVNAVQRFSYARVFQDCLHCVYCSEIRYQQSYRGYREVPTLPEEVWCWGARPDLLEILTAK